MAVVAVVVAVAAAVAAAGAADLDRLEALDPRADLDRLEALDRKPIGPHREAVVRIAAAALVRPGPQAAAVRKLIARLRSARPGPASDPRTGRAAATEFPIARGDGLRAGELGTVSDLAPLPVPDLRVGRLIGPRWVRDPAIDRTSAVGRVNCLPIALVQVTESANARP